MKLATPGARASHKWCVCAADIRSTIVKLGQSSIYIIYARCEVPFYAEMGHKVSIYFSFYETTDIQEITWFVCIYLASTSWWLLSTFIPYIASMLPSHFTQTEKTVKFHGTVLDPKAGETVTYNPRTKAHSLVWSVTRTTLPHVCAAGVASKKIYILHTVRVHYVFSVTTGSK